MKGKTDCFTAMSAAVIFISAAAAYSQGKIAFDSCGDGNCEIYLIDPDGGGEVRLTFHPASDSQPSVSANGTKIAFRSTRVTFPHLATTTVTDASMRPCFDPPALHGIRREVPAAHLSTILGSVEIARSRTLRPLAILRG